MIAASDATAFRVTSVREGPNCDQLGRTADRSPVPEPCVTQVTGYAYDEGASAAEHMDVVQEVDDWSQCRPWHRPHPGC